MGIRDYYQRLLSEITIGKNRHQKLSSKTVIENCRRELSARIVKDFLFINKNQKNVIIINLYTPLNTNNNL